MEKQDTSGNERERERECESETVVVVSTCLFLRATLKAGLILILARTGLKKLKQLQTGCYAFIDPRTPVQKLTVYLAAARFMNINKQNFFRCSRAASCYTTAQDG